jgi:8-oxo-dGTP pyrophosphatase MutT (NUDIX family)
MDNPQCEQRAGGIVFRRVNSRIEYLLITSNSNKNRWIFPAGHVENGETYEETALREVGEEAGVFADIICKLGNYHYSWYRDNRKTIIDTHLFLMQYLKTFCKNPEGRQVDFFSYEAILNLNLWEESRDFMAKAHSLVNELP